MVKIFLIEYKIILECEKYSWKFGKFFFRKEIKNNFC